jgi:hypothetical protein
VKLVSLFLKVGFHLLLLIAVVLATTRRDCLFIKLVSLFLKVVFHLLLLTAVVLATTRRDLVPPTEVVYLSSGRTQLMAVLVTSQWQRGAVLRASVSVENSVRTSGALQLRSGWCRAVCRG